MKRISLCLVIILIFTISANASMSYECNRYVNDDFKGFTTIVANNKQEAESKAYIKFKEELGKKVDYVICK
jgi:hypothetical protein